MKKKNLSLKSLRVTSFVTNNSNSLEMTQKVKGGSNNFEGCLYTETCLDFGCGGNTAGCPNTAGGCFTQQACPSMPPACTNFGSPCLAGPDS